MDQRPEPALQEQDMEQLEQSTSLPRRAITLMETKLQMRSGQWLAIQWSLEEERQSELCRFESSLLVN